MAIIVEEEKKKTNAIGLLGWLGILIAVVVAAYYIFFAAPELVVIPPSGSLGEIAPIVSTNLNPSDVINSPAFQVLQSTIPPINPSSTASGRSNPFLAP